MRYFAIFFLIFVGFAGTAFAQLTDNKDEGTSGILVATTDNTKYNIPYSITSGTVNEITPICDSASAIVLFASDNPGKLTVDIPRNMLDSNYNDISDEFFVLLDGEEIEFEETSNKHSRMVTISFEPGSYDLEIVAIWGPLSLEYGGFACKAIHDPPYSYILSPLKQIKSGIPYHETICKSGLQLAQRHDGSPVCVNPATIPKLVERGWANDTSDIHILRYSPVLFDGTGTNLQEEELIEYLKNKRDYLDTAIDEVGAKGLHPITGMSFSIGNNAYSIDEEYAGNPIALDIRVLKEKFTKKTLEEVHQFVRQHVGDDIDIVFSKGGYTVPTPMTSTSENNPQHDTKYPDFPTIDSLLPEDRLQVRNQAGYTIIHITLSSWTEYKEWENRRGSESTPIPPISITENTMDPIIFDMLYEMWQFEDYETSEHNPTLYHKTIQKDYLVQNHHGIRNWMETEYKKQFDNSSLGFSNYFEFRDHVYRVSMLAID